MENQIGSDAVGVDASEYFGLSLCYRYYPEYESYIKRYDGERAGKTFFFADCAEDEVGVLFGNVFELGLGTVEEAFAGQTSGADGNFRLVDVVAGSAEVFLDA